MTINEKLELKAPEGKFAVCLWDGYPRMEPPTPEIIDTFDKEEDARKYAREMNEELQREFYDKGGEKLTTEDIVGLVVAGQGGRNRMIEPDYFVMDDRGCRID